MKISRTRKILVALCALLLVGAAGAFAATDGTAVLTGTVASVLSISVVEEGAYNSLDLTANGTDSDVALVTVECNDPDGYTVTMVTTNGATGGLFEGADVDNSETLAYTVKYGPTGTESAVTFTAGSSEVESTSARSTVGGDARNILISWTAPGTPLSADTYSDTLTLTIAAK